MTPRRFRVRGADDFLLFAERVDAPDDDRAYYAITELWPVWLDIEARYGENVSSRDPRVVAMLTAAATDADFDLHPSFGSCDACGSPYRFVEPEGIHTHCACSCASKGADCPLLKEPTP